MLVSYIASGVNINKSNSLSFLNIYFIYNIFPLMLDSNYIYLNSKFSSVIIAKHYLNCLSINNNISFEANLKSYM